MRARLILLVLAILLVTGFAALNWSDMMRTTPLNFGLFVMDAPLGVILLGLLILGLVVFLISSAVQRSHVLHMENRYSRELQAQRDLADKAESSRFTDLRTHLDTHFRQDRERLTLASSDFEKSVLQSQRELRTQLDEINRTLDARLAELEGRIDARTARATAAVDVNPRPMDTRPIDPRPLDPGRDRVKL